MKVTNTIKLFTCAILLCALGTVTSCKKEDKNGACGPSEEACSNQVDEPKPGGIVFATGGTKLNVDAMVTAIAANLKNRVTGYQIAVCNGGTIAAAEAWGSAKQWPDCYVQMNDCSRFNIASQSKTITTAALLQLLDANGLTIDSAVAPYLPNGWQRTAYMNRLCFRHFLSHRTAFAGANSATPTTSDWNACKTFVESVPQPAMCPNQNIPDQNTFDYKNCNLALMRIIIPTLWKNLNSAPAELKNAATITDALCTKYYELYVQQFVLAPSGATGTLTQTNPGNVLFYNYGTLDAGDEYFLDWTGHGGGGGWVMNAVNVARTMHAIGYKDAVCTPANRAIMRGHPTLGWRAGFLNTTTTSQGVANGHGGDLNSQQGEMHGNYAILPNGVVVSVMINSDDPDGNQANDLFNYIINAYEDAIE